jgi:NMD protein affecting ribosome stability and mRNA decay
MTNYTFVCAECGKDINTPIHYITPRGEMLCSDECIEVHYEHNLIEGEDDDQRKLYDL